ncbi:outer membrane protein [Bradyrhizobium sp. NFR13]|uniref:OmpW/AlkL family protein n=1 Tax=Bradyrhizobium sp. NFR13 TaxID=1566285 RepID=UPI0008F1B958|nr:OmpW family protein [Bradyrhizobium sp. NFR13]SFM14525.1 outer membrane protein [Bradyrhizobium sp. NFR13]
MKRILTTMSLLMAATAMTSMATTAGAADLPAATPYYKAPVVEVWNPWMIRLRVLGVIPENGGTVHQVPGSSLKTSDQVVPELDISYFFTPNLAAELILGVTKHHVTGDGAIAGLDVGKAWLLPPTLTFQYHFTQFGAFKPYIGAGVNYTWFFSQSASGLGVTNSRLKDTAAPVLQFGFDYMIDKHWGWNVDVKKMWMRPDWEGTLASGAAITGQVKLDPWLVGTGITYKF